MLISTIKMGLGSKAALNNEIDRKAVSRYLLSLAAAKLDYVLLQSKEEAFVDAVMRLPYEDVAEKRMFCQDMGLLIRDLRFPMIWNVQHLGLFLKLHRSRQPADDLACFRIPVVLKRQAGFGIYPILTELVDQLDNCPATSLQWLEVLRMLCREIEPASIVQLVNSGCLCRLNGEQLQQLCHLRADQLRGLSLLLNSFKEVETTLLNLIIYFIRRMEFTVRRLHSTGQLLYQFVQEVLPQAEARVNKFDCSFLSGGSSQSTEKAYFRAFGLFVFWLLHQERSVEFQTDNFKERPVEKHSQGALRDFRQLPFQKVLAYLPIRWLWGLPALLGHHRELLLHLAAGNNIRSFRGLRLPVSRRMAHLFHNLPPVDHLSQWELDASFRDAFLAWLGIDDRLRPAVPPFKWVDVGSRSYRYPYVKRLRRQFPKWKKVLMRLVFLTEKEPAFIELPRPEIRILFGYFRHLIDEGLPLSLKGSTLSSLQRRAEAWHQASRLRQIARNSDSETVLKSWPGASYRELELQVEETLYQIVQVTTLDALFEEADTLRHCVWRYHPKCVKGTCSIWSLRKFEENRITRLVTIEVNGNGRIVQARGKFNAKPECLYLDLIEKWTAQEKLVFQRSMLP